MAINTQAALRLAADLVRANPIYGQEAKVQAEGAILIVHYAQTLGVSCRLYVVLDFVGGAARPRVEVSWPSTNHSVAQAQASIALFQAVTNLAALIQASLDNEAIRPAV